MKDIHARKLAEWPSQNGGMRPGLPFPARMTWAAAMIFAGSAPMRRFVPSENGDGALGGLAKREAGDAKSRGFFWNAARIGED